jgi:hypothetical protein
MGGGAATYELNLESNAGSGLHTMQLKANEEGRKEVRLYGIVIDDNGGQHVIQQVRRKNGNNLQAALHTGSKRMLCERKL